MCFDERQVPGDGDRARVRIAGERRSKRIELGLLVRPEWMPYRDALRVAAPDAARVDLEVVATPERKTGVKHANVAPVQLMQDDRGWLRLAS